MCLFASVAVLLRLGFSLVTRDLNFAGRSAVLCGFGSRLVGSLTAAPSAAAAPASPPRLAATLRTAFVTLGLLRLGLVARFGFGVRLGALGKDLGSFALKLRSPPLAAAAA